MVNKKETEREKNVGEMKNKRRKEKGMKNKYEQNKKLKKGGTK
jgi:hypothetical protein